MIACRRSASLRALAVSLALSAMAQAANHTTNVQQGVGENWNTATIWTPNSAPTAGETYETVAGGAASPTRLRNPTTAGTVVTFGGDSLKLDTGTEIRFKSGGGDTTVNFPVNGLIMNGGTLNTGDAGLIFTIGGVMNVAAPSFINTQDSNNPTIVQGDRAYKISALISGSSSLTLSTGRTATPAFELTGTNNTFSGDWIDTGGYFKATGVGSLGSGNIFINGSAATPAIFDTDYSLSLPTKSLVLLNTSSQWILDQNYVLGAVSINGTNLPPGAYSQSTLAAMFPSNFAAGSIPTSIVTVVPEPTGAAFLAMGGVTLLRRRRVARP